LFGDADRASNVANIDEILAPHLDKQTAAYWNARDWRGRRRCTVFARGFYRYGLLGNFIQACHLIAKLHGVDPARILKAESREQQQEFFRSELEPLLKKPLVKWLIARPQALFGLGIPPSQYVSLAGDHDRGIGEVLRQRLEKLACGFPLSQNYFAQQAFGRRYLGGQDRSLPPYLEEKNYSSLTANSHKITIRQQSFTDALREATAGAYDRYVLLDAQDWMNDVELTDLWREITRTSSPGARVIFRTAAAPSLLPGRLPDQLLSQWRYEADQSTRLSDQDRSAIYGGFHLYTRAN
jgi:S-adenosylmethionine-diacylglycerol 3-amino-3-carboxypropyl transferase